MKYMVPLIMIALCSQFSTELVSQQSASTVNSVDQYDNSAEPSCQLSETDRRIINQRISRILEKDQQFRSYLSFGTTDDEKIAEISKLDAQGQLKAMSENRKSLSEEVKPLLDQLQLKNDRENYAEFFEIVKQYGYPSPERLG